MVATSHDGLTSSVFPQYFTYYQGIFIAFAVDALIIYPPRVLSGFKKQFIRKEFAEELCTAEVENE